MRYLALSLVAIFLVGCTRTPDEIRVQTDKLLAREKQVRQEIRNLETEKQNLAVNNDSLRTLKEEVRALEIQKNGGEVEYILICELSQDRSSSLSSGSIKDYLNAVEIQIPVDRKTYNHYKRVMNSSEKGERVLR
jgi:hypothetical protein